jgi:rod shape-determining protein MreD
VRVLRGLAFLLPALAVALVLDAACLGLTHGARLFDPWLVIVVAAATRGRKVDAMLAATLVGLTQDIATGGVFGVYLLAKVTVGYLASLGAGRLVPGQPLTALVLLGGGTVAEQLVILAAGIVLGQSPNARTPVELAVAVVLNVVIGTAALALLDRSRAKRPGMAHARR